MHVWDVVKLLCLNFGDYHVKFMQIPKKKTKQTNKKALCLSFWWKWKMKLMMLDYTLLSMPYQIWNPETTA